MKAARHRGQRQISQHRIPYPTFRVLLRRTRKRITRQLTYQVRQLLQARLLIRLLVLFSLLVLALGMTASLGAAQSPGSSTGSLKEQEDQFIRQYDLPSAPAEPPVYKPLPAAQPKQESAAQPKRESLPPPKQESAPPPQRRFITEPAPPPPEEVAPEPAPPPPAPEAPPRRRSEPVEEPVDSPSDRQPVSTEREPVSTEREPISTEREPEPEPKPRSRPSLEDSESSPRDRISEETSDELAEPSDTADDTEPLPTGEYVVEFNRAPVVGNRFRLQGVHSEARLGFTRPRGWKLQSVKALIRYQHSPALLANRSNLTVRVNDRSIGSVPLNRKESQVGSMVFDIPPKLLQDYNDLLIVAQQNNDPQCSDPSDATLWTEILPDSKLLFKYQTQPIPLSFRRYPYPFFDELSLEPNRMAYLLPKLNEAWLTAAPRFQAALGRLADFHPMETRLVQGLNDVKPNEQLVVIGTPGDQPALKSLALPFKISANQILDKNKVPLAENVGVLMLTTAQKGSVPVLVVTGNGSEGVIKAAQFLAQPDTSKLGTGQAILVNDLKPIPTPPPRQWPRYLPEKNSFTLSEIKNQVNGKPFEDITVRGSGAPPIELDFRALPDDQFTRGSSMNLVYSYGPQVNPRLSAVEVLLNDENVFIGGARLTSEEGATRQTLKVDLPAKLIKPTSKLKVAFRLNPREVGRCGRSIDQQLTGTLHADTSFNLNRDTSVQLPDLELLRSGYPFAAPQDLSSTAMVVPDNPSNTDLLTLLAFSERLGRLSEADSVKLSVYTADALPPNIRKTHHLVGIGTRDKFPFPKVLESGNLQLSKGFLRQWNQASIRTLPDTDGVIKEIISPDNSERVLLTLSAQTEKGLDRVRQVISKDPWFFQLREDTVLISSDRQNPSAYEPDAYRLEFLRRAPSTKRLENTNLLGKASRFLQENWFLLPAGIVAIALLLYGIAQLYLNRLTDKKSH